MEKRMTKAQPTWVPTPETLRNISDADAVTAFEAAQYRYEASMRDLENAFEAEASKLRAEFVAAIAVL